MSPSTPSKRGHAHNFAPYVVRNTPGRSRDPPASPEGHRVDGRAKSSHPLESVLTGGEMIDIAGELIGTGGMRELKFANFKMRLDSERRNVQRAADYHQMLPENQARLPTNLQTPTRKGKGRALAHPPSVQCTSATPAPPYDAQAGPSHTQRSSASAASRKLQADLAAARPATGNDIEDERVEEARVEKEKRKREEKRKRVEEDIKKMEEVKRQADEVKRQAEEAKRQAEEAKMQIEEETKRLGEERKSIEEERRRVEEFAKEMAELAAAKTDEVDREIANFKRSFEEEQQKWGAEAQARLNARFTQYEGALREGLEELWARAQQGTFDHLKACHEAAEQFKAYVQACQEFASMEALRQQAGQNGSQQEQNPQDVRGPDSDAHDQSAPNEAKEQPEPPAPTLADTEAPPNVPGVDANNVFQHNYPSSTPSTDAPYQKAAPDVSDAGADYADFLSDFGDHDDFDAMSTFSDMEESQQEADDMPDAQYTGAPFFQSQSLRDISMQDTSMGGSMMSICSTASDVTMMEDDFYEHWEKQWRTIESAWSLGGVSLQQIPWPRLRFGPFYLIEQDVQDFCERLPERLTVEGLLRHYAPKHFNRVVAEKLDEHIRGEARELANLCWHMLGQFL